MNFLMYLFLLCLAGCQSWPKDPKQPDTSPKVPINKTVPPELQETFYEHPAH